MVSFRNFISICTMMAVLFFMFQFFQLFKEYGNNYEINEYATDTMLSGEDQWTEALLKPAGIAGTAEGEETPEDMSMAGGIAFLGKPDSDLAGSVRQWCRYTKRAFYATEPEVLLEAEDLQADMILIDCRSFSLPAQEEELVSLGDAGVTVVFLNLPNVRIMEECPKLRKMIGISSVKERSVETEGIEIFADFLLGGRAVFKESEKVEPGKELQDLDLVMPWYRLGKGTKVYMVGMLDEEMLLIEEEIPEPTEKPEEEEEEEGKATATEEPEQKKESLPPLLWRTTYRNNFVFAVNGSYMNGLSALGLLDAIDYERQDYILYPIVNADATSVTGYPGFADENAEKLMELYSRKEAAVQRDIMWPGIAALSEKYGRKLTCFMTPQYDYDDWAEPMDENFVFFMQQMKEIGGEAGLTLLYRGNISLKDKIDRDAPFWEEYASTYRFCACYVGAKLDENEKELIDKGYVKDLRTVVKSYDGREDLLRYYNDSVTIQCITGSGGNYSFSQDLQRRSLNTALGYSNLLMDLLPVMYPESKQDQWEIYFDDMSGNVGTYWSSKGGFDSVSLTESDGRVRNFLNLRYTQTREKDAIVVHTERCDEAWFLLRIHDENVGEVQGGESRKLEDGVWLIHAMEPEVRIEFEKDPDQIEFLFKAGSVKGE